MKRLIIKIGITIGALAAIFLIRYLIMSNLYARMTFIGHATINYSREEVARMEILKFINEGLQNVYGNKLMDFDTTFDELEERYNANE